MLAHLAWLFALSAWLAVGTVLLSTTKPSQAASDLLGGLMAVAVLATILYGAFLATRRLRFELLAGPVLGLGALMIWYVIAMAAADTAGQQGADDAAGVGVVILAIPTFAVLAGLVGIGAGLVALCKRIGHRD